MKYSDFSREQFMRSKLYEKIGNKLLSLAQQDEETRRKIERNII